MNKIGQIICKYLVRTLFSNCIIIVIAFDIYLSITDAIPDENLCKICMEANIDSLLLDCGHMITCTECGRLLHDCPICRQIIVRVVRAFKS